MKEPPEKRGHGHPKSAFPALVVLNDRQAPARQRQERILQLVRDKGYVTNEFLARHFSVTPQTIRRDINMLCRDGWLQRYHGGAGPSSSIENVTYSERRIICLKEKQQIGSMAAGHIPEKASLFINIGTTTEEVARALCNHHQLRVITNNLNVATILSKNENFEIMVSGGKIRNRDCAVTGEATVDFIRQFKVDYGIIGISGIDSDGSLMDFDYGEVRAARTIIDNSRKVYLVVDHTKFGRKAMVRLGNIVEIDALFTDRVPPVPVIKMIKNAGGAIHTP
jgi:DeoR family glycerol-3-phosphate regulon repressor